MHVYILKSIAIFKANGNWCKTLLRSVLIKYKERQNSKEFFNPLWLFHMKCAKTNEMLPILYILPIT